MTYTVDQLLGKLERADAAGDAEAAKVIADEIRRMESAAKPAPAAKPKPPQGGFGRQMGLGLRNTVEGVTDALGIVGNPINYAVSALAGKESPTLSNQITGQRERIPYQTMTQAAGGLLDRLGVPRPETPGERIVSDVGRGLTGTAVTMGAGSIPAASRYASPVAQAVGQGFSAQPGLQALSATAASGAGGMARENGATPGQQAGLSLLAGLTPGATRYLGSMGTRGVMRGGEQGRVAMERGMQDFRANGAEPSVGQATGNRRTQGMESLLAGGPTSGGVMVRAAEKQADALGQGLQNRADAFFPNASAERAGRAIESGVDTFVGNVGATRKALYWQADKLIPDTTTLPMNRTQQALAQLTTPNPNAPATTGAMINPKIRNLADTVAQDLAAAPNGLPYSTVKDIRSRIGAELSDFSLSTDKPTAEYKRLYAALSQDMEEAARRQGPAAEQAARRANDYFKASASRIETLQRVVDKNGGPEKVYAAVMSGTQDGGTTLRSVMQSLPADGRKAVTGAVIKRMGLATKGQQSADGDKFSAQTFLTNWNGVSKEAKRALFDRYGPKFSGDMDKIARVAERITNGSKVFANPSGTANRGLAYGYIASVAGAAGTGQGGALAGLLAGGLGANISARMMTSPRFVSWLARTTELPTAALPAQAVALQAIAKQEDDEEMAALAAELAKNQGR